MKKIIVLAASLIFALSFTACNNQTVNDIQSDMNSATESVTDFIESTADAVSDTVQSAESALNSAVTSTAKITADDAKATALKHAGLTESDVTNITVDLDRDDGILKYEIDFYSGGIEYDYDVNAETGYVISADKELD